MQNGLNESALPVLALKPDFAVGFMSSAFNDDEVEKVKSYTAHGKATLFTGKPFFCRWSCVR